MHFDFDLDGTDSLVRVSRQPHLATHVRTIGLQRRHGLKRFDDFWTWQQATIYDYEPLIPRDGHDQVRLSADIMFASDWHHTSDDSRRALFDDYQDNYHAITRRTSHIAFAMSSAIQQSHGYISDLQNATEAHQRYESLTRPFSVYGTLQTFTTARHMILMTGESAGVMFNFIERH